VNGGNQFAIELFSGFGEQRGNLTMSPFCVNYVLAMTLAGANGETAHQISDVLHLRGNIADVHTEYSVVMKMLDTRGKSSDFNTQIYNGVFAQAGYKITDSFQSLIRDKYSATFRQIDMTGWPNEFNPQKAMEARLLINKWLAESTHNRISEIVPATIPDSETRLLLVSALWLKGTWMKAFPSALTSVVPFHLEEGHIVTVPTMHVTTDCRYAENETFQVLELQYSTKRFSMVVMLPKPEHKLQKLEKLLSNQQINELLHKLKREKVSISLPRFKAHSSIDLRPKLEGLGLKVAFTSAANFSEISKDGPMSIGSFVHSASIEVDEMGTEAAAASMNELVSFGATDSPIAFNANHPFLYIIRDAKTECILFIGRVADPSTP